MLFISFSVDSAMIPIMVNALEPLNARTGEHIGISPLTKTLTTNHSASHGDFSILTHENRKLLLELKEDMLIMRDKRLILI